MHNFIKLTFFSLIFFFSLAAKSDQTLIVEDFWIRDAPPTSNVLAAYMTLKNITDQDIILIGTDSPTFKQVMFHKTEIKNGLAKMLHLDEVIIPAHSSFEFSPGNFHMMLMGKKNILTVGDHVEFTLSFKNIDDQNVTATVKKKTN